LQLKPDPLETSASHSSAADAIEISIFQDLELAELEKTVLKSITQHEGGQPLLAAAVTFYHAKTPGLAISLQQCHSAAIQLQSNNELPIVSLSPDQREDARKTTWVVPVIWRIAKQQQPMRQSPQGLQASAFAFKL
jgi:hypothetical protein